MEKQHRIDEAAVWKRVNAVTEQREKPLESPLLPGLRKAMTEGAGLYDAYAALYSRTGSGVYSRLAREQRQENKSLKSLYFLLSGENPSVQGQKAEDGGDVPARLRLLLHGQQTHLETLGALVGQSTGNSGAVLRDLSAQADQRWHDLLRLLQKQLGNGDKFSGAR